MSGERRLGLPYSLIIDLGVAFVSPLLAPRDEALAPQPAYCWQAYINFRIPRHGLQSILFFVTVPKKFPQQINLESAPSSGMSFLGE